MTKKMNQKGFSLIEGLLVIIALALVIFVGYYVYHSQKQTDKTYSTAAKDAQSGPSKSSPSTKSASKLITYDPIIEIRAAGDVSQLKGAPQSFKDFMSGQITASLSEATDENCGSTFFSVNKIYDSSYAMGGVGQKDCGGAQAVWALYQGNWEKVYVGQQAVSCDVINKYKVPKVLVEQCFDSNEQLVANTN
ncbi:MAG TPA: prepilin-type N-terminal cleavage/methylation domain-containing protein [Candidatus Saccharimonadales bacterium]